MHKVFINNRPLVFENVYGEFKDKYNGLVILSDSGNSLEDVIFRMVNENIPGIIYLSASPDNMWNLFTGKFTLVEAAGGVVVNEKGEVLAIYRKKSWDLPKGKLDYNEAPESAAVREVREECGLKIVELNSFLMKTYHVYTEKKSDLLKKTHWFTMTSDSSEKLSPQLEEKIEIARWMDKEEIEKVFMPDTYQSIREVLEKYYTTVQFQG
jgi:8-oxo-dGTP pyrophosphatase MutT (NUDIX family)